MWADGQTERDTHTHTTQQIVVFRGFAKAPKNEVVATNLSQYHCAHHSSIRSGTTETQNRAITWTQL